jgi:hypothetical protein
MDEKDKARGRATVIRPTYEMDERLGVLVEVNKPPTNLFMELGWDREPNSDEGYIGEKHYRKYHNHELESTKEIMSETTVFDECEIKRG